MSTDELLAEALRLTRVPDARAELRSAAFWYDERRPGLGDEFIAEVSAAFDRVADVPESYPAWPSARAAGPPVREAILERFAYVIALERLREKGHSSN